METLYLKTGLQQYQKISAMPDAKEQMKLLLELLVAECDKFKFMPDADKKAHILDRMISDGDFQGFNPKILNKWFREVYIKYIPNQSDFVEIEREPAAPEVAEKYINQWRQELAKIGVPKVSESGEYAIKDHRVRLLKEQFRGKECKHSGVMIEISDTECVCNDCGKTLAKKVIDQNL